MRHWISRHTPSLLFLGAALFVGSAAAGPSIEWAPLHEPGSGGRLSGIAVSPHDNNHVLLGGDMLGIGVSLDRGDSWLPAFGLMSWEIADFTFHPSNPDIVWAGTMSGPYISRDKGIHWQSRRSGMPPLSGGHYSVPIQKILFHPSDAEKLLAFGGSHRHWHNDNQRSEFGAVWKSDNGGESWSYVTTLGGTRGSGRNIVAATRAGTSADTLYAAVDNAGVFVSFDGGATWTARNKGFACTDPYWVEAHPRNSRIAWVAMDNHLPGDASKRLPGRIYKTIDAGRTWNEFSAGLPDIVTGTDPNRTARYEIIRVSPSNPDLLVTANTSWPRAGLYLSRDGGATWARTGREVDKAYVSGQSMEIACFDPDDSNTIFAAGASYVLRTIDGGTTWTDATSYRPKGKSTWRGRGYSGLVSKNFRFHPRDPAVSALTAMDHGNFWISRDTMHTWTWGGEGFPNFGGGNDIAFSGDNTIFVTLGQSSDFKGIARTRDNGRTWDILSGNGLPSSGSANNRGGSIHALPDDSSRAWAAVGGTLYVTVDCGATWKKLFTAAAVNWMAASPGDDPTLYLATDKGMYRGRAGRDFTRITGGPEKPDFCAIDPRHPDTIYVTSWRQGDGGVWRFDGSAWKRLQSDKFARSVAVHPENGKIIMYTTDDHPYHDSSFASGVYLSRDYGATWEQANAGLACLRGSVIAFNPHDPGRVVLGTGGRGFFIGRLSGTDPVGIHPGFSAGVVPRHSTMHRLFDLKGRIVPLSRERSTGRMRFLIMAPSDRRIGACRLTLGGLR